MSMNRDSYSEEDAQEILRRAASLQTSGAMSVDEMIRAAAELGISREAVEQAEAQLRSDRLDKELLKDFRRQERQKFFSSIGSAIAIIAIAFIWFFEGHPSKQWVLIGAAFFGWKLVSNFSQHLWERSDSWQRRYQTWKAAEVRRRDPGRNQKNEDVIKSILGSVDPEAKLAVIKELRQRSGLELKEAKDAVDEYYRRHPEIRVSSSS
jgi:hypothetical protein